MRQDDSTVRNADAMALSDAAANRRELVALLRREGRHSGVWFGDKLTEAADLIEDLAGAAFAIRSLAPTGTGEQGKDGAPSAIDEGRG